MREIKFRGWTVSTKQMIYEGWNETGAASFFIAKGDLFDYGDSMQIMQYTGLNDNNGTEIYEGDIVRCIDFSLTENFTWNKDVRIDQGSHVVEWDNEFAGFFVDGLALSGFNELEVIGNIYENPELLNKEQGVQGSDTTKMPNEQKPD